MIEILHRVPFICQPRQQLPGLLPGMEIVVFIVGGIRAKRFKVFFIQSGIVDESGAVPIQKRIPSAFEVAVIREEGDVALCVELFADNIVIVGGSDTHNIQPVIELVNKQQVHE